VANTLRITEITERLDQIDAHTAEQKATMILVGLGFTEDNILLPSKKILRRMENENRHCKGSVL
jgi:ATPase subunit of ABC transporter with duplicated ATPase domains